MVSSFQASKDMFWRDVVLFGLVIYVCLNMFLNEFKALYQCVEVDSVSCFASLTVLVSLLIRESTDNILCFQGTCL